MSEPQAPGGSQFPGQPQPSAPFAPPAQYQQPPPSDNTRKWLYIGGGTAVALIAVIVLLLTGVIPGATSDKSEGDNAGGSTGDTTQSTAAASNDAKPIPSSDLEKLLPSDSETAAIVKPDPGSTTDIVKFLYTDVYDNADCGPYTSVGINAAYRGSGWSSARQKRLTYSDDKATGNQSRQAVIAFPDASRASKQYEAILAKWNSCANQPVNTKTATYAGYDYAMGGVTESDGIATKTMTAEGGDGWSCRFAMATRNNLILESMVCGQDISDDMPVQLVKAAESKVAQ